MGDTRKVVVLSVTATFEGDYYDASECPAMLECWIDRGFEDRDNLRGWSVETVSVTESPLELDKESSAV
ncbi:hypothetical protein ACIOHC_35800 [Streptomyces sp. NPDC088252]|uniref:hypothetical protein n=1 Tax=Streptomyces sp. NPDC088252 TaxID=3365845 RepID=UPI0038113733